MFSSYNSVQGGEVFIENSATSKVIGEGIVQFCFHDGCIITRQGIHHVLDLKYNLISLGALHREGFNFNSEGDLMKVFKGIQVKFQAERVRNVYMLRNSKVTIGGMNYHRHQEWRLWIFGDYDDFEFGCSILPRRQIRTRQHDAQQGSSDHYPYVGVNSHKFCVDQEDHWVIKFKSGLNLFDLIKL